jgi:hypothetical protein
MTELRKDSIAAALLLTLLVPYASFCQSQKSHRASYGELRATVMESLLEKIYPGSRFQWDPDLRVEIDGAFQDATFQGFSLIATSNGEFEGATGIQVGKAKEEFLYNSEHFRPATPREFSAELVIFETNAAGIVTRMKSFPLDSSDPLAKIKTVDVKAWPPNTWPLVRVQYDSYFAHPDSFTTLEWNGMFDTASGKFMSRIPLGFAKSLKNGGEEIHAFSITRQDASTVRILDQLTKDAVQYQCSEPCVVNADKLLSDWEYRLRPRSR